MCDPVSLASATWAVSQVATVAQYVGGQRRADDQLHAANRTFAQQNNEAALQRTQVDARQSEDSVDALIKAQVAQGRISASAAALGSDAATVAQQSNAADFDIGRGLTLANANADNTRLGIQQGLAVGEQQRQNTIGNIQAPGPLSLALGIVQNNLQGAASAMKMGA